MLVNTVFWGGVLFFVSKFKSFFILDLRTNYNYTLMGKLLQNGTDGPSCRDVGTKSISKKLKRSFNIKKLFFACLFFFAANAAFSHGNQVAYCVMPNGFIRIYIEHWHGDLDVNGLVGNGMNITTTYGSTTITQDLNPTGGIVNTTVNNLPNGGSGVTVIATCPGGANMYNDWAYYDFAPAVCGTPVALH